MKIIEVKVKGMFLMDNRTSGIILEEIGGYRSLPIVIGEYEAQSIALGLEKIKTPRPITHDLIVSILSRLGAEPKSVLINNLINNTYFALLRIMADGELIEIDSRPSDALAVAVRLGLPIFVKEEILNDIGLENLEVEKELDILKELAEDKSSELEKLKKALDKAVELEDYEKAAEIRDKIKYLENKD